MIKGIIKKIIYFPFRKERKLEAVELWSVRWKRRYGKWESSTEPVAEFFTNKEDAEYFAERLKEAKNLLQYTETINIRVEKE